MWFPEGLLEGVDSLGAAAFSSLLLPGMWTGGLKLQWQSWVIR